MIADVCSSNYGLRLQYLGSVYASQIVQVMRAAYQEYEEMNLTPRHSAHDETEIDVLKRLETRTCLGILDQDKVIGSLFTYNEPAGVYITRVSVLPSYRRLKIGYLLISAAEELACALRRERLFLGVHKDLPHLQTFYERCGYRLAHEQKYDYWTMEKFITLPHFEEGV